MVGYNRVTQPTNTGATPFDAAAHVHEVQLGVVQ